MFGKKNRIYVRVDLTSYGSAHHVTQNCPGKFKLVLIKNYIYSDTILGPIRLGVAPVILCKKCGTEYLAPKFDKWLEREISKGLILSKGVLSKKQIKFLRQDFDFTQEELGRRLGLRKEQVAKMENPKYSDHMSIDKQFRLKFHLAKILKLKDINQLQEIIEDKEVEISSVIPSKREIEQVCAQAA